MRHVVMFSSGAGSWAAAKRVASKHGTDGLTLLFADAGEDADNYRFLIQAADNVGGKLVMLTGAQFTHDDAGDHGDPRTIFEVYFDEHMLGNSRVAPCSKRLKQIPARNWMEANCPDPSEVTIYVGIDWTENHRVEPNQRGWAPYTVEAPLTEAPYLSKPEILAQLRAEGIEPPRLYAQGFTHANCGGGCCRMGIAQAAHLLRARPETFAMWEREEEKFRAHFQKDVSFLKDRKGGEAKPLPLRVLRERLEQGWQYDLFDLGGCGCFTPEADDPPSPPSPRERSEHE